jgi:hypothetical protein
MQSEHMMNARPAGRRLWLLMAVMAVTVAALTATATVAAMAASDRFGDVAPGHPHEAGIGFAVDSGVTAGCGDGSNYCPGNPVTRDQMATFLHRLSGHSPDAAPSVDAATVQGMTPADLKGQDGNDGRDGADGQDGVSGWQLVEQEQLFGVTGSGDPEVSVSCPAGTKALGGGFSQSGSSTHPALDSRPMEDGAGWQVRLDGEADTTWKFSATVYAICAEMN